MALLRAGDHVLHAGKVALVRFYGTTHLGAGAWLGLEFDRAIGKNDGSVDGVRYFTCGHKCGLFVRPSRVEVLSEGEAVRHKRKSCSPGPAGTPQDSLLYEGFESPEFRSAVLVTHHRESPSDSRREQAKRAQRHRDKTDAMAKSSRDRKQGPAPRQRVTAAHRHSQSAVPMASFERLAQDAFRDAAVLVLQQMRSLIADAHRTRSVDLAAQNKLYRALARLPKIVSDLREARVQTHSSGAHDGSSDWCARQLAEIHSFVHSVKSQLPGLLATVTGADPAAAAGAAAGAAAADAGLGAGAARTGDGEVLALLAAVDAEYAAEDEDAGCHAFSHEAASGIAAAAALTSAPSFGSMSSILEPVVAASSPQSSPQTSTQQSSRAASSGDASASTASILQAQPESTAAQQSQPQPQPAQPQPQQTTVGQLPSEQLQAQHAKAALHPKHRQPTRARK